MLNVIRAPWSEEIVEILNTKQAMAHHHEYICPVPANGVKVPLRATTEGWRCNCGHTQDWVREEDTKPIDIPNGFALKELAHTH